MPKNDETLALNIADIEPVSVANGPGRRFVIWVQGCPFRCLGCSNSEFLAFVPARRYTVQEMYERIIAEDSIEGVTFSGGEPMAQAYALSVLAEKIKSAGLSIVCFSGFTLEEIQAKPDSSQRKLLAQIDVLIDGRYNQEKAGGGLIGSTNQKLHFLSGAYKDYAKEIGQSKTIELATGNGVVRATGVLDSQILNRLNEVLQEGPRHLISLDD